MIDLSQLPAPTIVEPLDFETLFAERKAALLALMPADARSDLADVLTLESEPLTKLLQESAYRELIWRQRVNEAARATLLAYARGTDLDNKAADYGVTRLLLKAARPDAVPPVPAEYESDERLRHRCQMALEGLTVAGSRGAYHFHALSAHAQIADASIDSPTFTAIEVDAAVRAMLPPRSIVLVCTDEAGLTEPLPGDVAVAILPRPDASLSADELVRITETALSADEVRPLTDRPRVIAGQPQDLQIGAVIEFEAGPDHALALSTAKERLRTMLNDRRRLGATLPRSAVFAALHVPGVRRVKLEQPAADVFTDLRHFPNCVDVKIAVHQP